MPTYCFRDKNTGEVTEKFMSISAREQFLVENPNLESLVAGAPGLSDPVRLGIRKPDAAFRDLIKNIKKNNIWSNIRT